MEGSIEHYFQESEGNPIIDKGIIGRIIQSRDGGEAEVINAVYNKKDNYITIRSGILTYNIHRRIFNNFRLID